MLQKIKSFLFENKTDKQTIIKNIFWLMLAEGISKFMKENYYKKIAL